MTVPPDTEPTVVRRQAQPYVAIKESVTMAELARVAHRIPEVLAWLADQGIRPAGPPFFKYDVINMADALVVEVGAPVLTLVPGRGAVIDGVLPAGRYATITHVGPPDELEAATARLLGWAAAQGIGWDVTKTDEGEAWGCRLEIYHTDPAAQPDMTKWETELAFRLAD